LDIRSHTDQERHPDRAADLRARFAAVRDATRRLAAPLSAEDCQPQSMPDASPVKWHLAHTTWFFETFVLDPHDAGFREFDPEYRVLFNSYYQSIGDQHPRPQRGLLTRPSLADVGHYRDHVEARVLALLANGDGGAATLDAIELGVHHEQQHQELILTDVKHLFFQNRRQPIYAAATPPAAPPASALEWTEFAGGLQRIGHGGGGFAFDNEIPRHRVVVEPYRLTNRLVTNGEYLDFMRDGGYADPVLWLSDGWTAVCERRWTAPLYWTQVDEGWRVFTLCGPRPLCTDEPVVHLSLYEADAFARWAGARLPSEAEWELAADGGIDDGNFVESGLFHPRSPAPGAGTRVQQLFGDVWEWTQSPYTAYPGYRPPAGAIGEYNGKFMANQIVLRGGSCATPRSHIRATYRNFFPPDARWQFSGLRLANDG
jgi:ergothioneine biosynthesis protein EgtB